MKTTKKTTKTKKTATRKKKASGAAVVPTLETLRATYPDAHCELVHKTAFQLLVATVLSAQSTDVGVNKATPGLFARYPDAASLARADVPTVERLIGTIGMFRQKSKRIVELAKLLVEKHGGEVPNRLEALVELPGVGRKTANVVLGVWFHAPVGVVVDTHVQRISQRLGWTRHTTPEKIELELMQKIPQKDWDRVAHILIFHGRRTCTARNPACERCPVNAVCPVAFRAEKVGRKPGRSARDAMTRDRSQ
jgi:endonuclease III